MRWRRISQSSHEPRLIQNKGANVRQKEKRREAERSEECEKQRKTEKRRLRKEGKTVLWVTWGKGEGMHMHCEMELVELV